MLDKNCRKWKLPVFIQKIAPKAMDGLKEICLEGLRADQVESWRPLLCAQRAVLQIHGTAGAECIWLPLSHTGGFEIAFPELVSSSMERKKEITDEPELRPEVKLIDFQAYDSRFSRIQDRDLKLDMAISRLLYPVNLEEKARNQYEQLLKNRFRPAMLQLVSGHWNRYGAIPEKARELLCLKKMDRFLKKELLEKAASSGQPEFTALIMEAAENNLKQNRAKSAGSAELLWKMAAGELYRRKPEMEYFCGMLTCCQVDNLKIGVSFVEKKSGNKKNVEKPFLLMGTDGFQIYYSKQSMQIDRDSSLKELSRLYTHMLLHCLYLHPFSRKKKGKYTELACDIAVEYAVDQIFGPAKSYAWERQWVYDMLRRSESIFTAEKIEKQLFQAPETWIDQLEKWFIVDNHSFWASESDQTDNLNFPGWRWEQEIQTEPGRWQAAANKWTAAGKGLLQTGQKKSGKRSPSAGHEQEEAKLTKRQGCDYHDFLQQFMVLREDMILDLDSYDPVYYTYGLNTYGNIPLVEPLETKEVMRLEELVIVIDTSGSCSGKLVRFFLEETWSVFGQSENFFNQFHVRILQCDAMVQEDVKLTSLRDAEQYMKNLIIKGGGGTDFREAFSYIRKLQKQGELMHLKGILYFTDGFGTYPARPPGCKTAFIFLKARFGQVEVPYWADKLLLELPEGADWEPEYTGGFQVTIR